MRTKSLFWSLIVLFVLSQGHGLAKGAWEQIECPPGFVPLVERVQPGKMLDPVEDEIRWTASSHGQAADGELALKETDRGTSLAVNFKWTRPEKDIQFLELRPKTRHVIEGPGRALVFSYRADQALDGSEVRYRIDDSTGETLQGNFAVVKDTDWRRVAARLDRPAGHWGGDNDGKIDYPARLRSILFDRPNEPKAQGTVLIDDVQWASVKDDRDPVLKIEAANTRVGNIYRPEEKVRIRLSLRRSPESEAAVKAATVNSAQEVLNKRELTLTDSPQELDLTPGSTGWYRTELTVSVEDGVIERRRFQFAVERAAEDSVSDPRFVLQGHFRGGYPLKIMPLLESRGASMFRDEMSWGSVERRKGEFDFPQRYLDYVKEAERLALDILLILDYSNRYYDEGGFPYSEDAREGFARYCRTIAGKFKDEIDHYEVWNEWSIGCGMDTKGDPDRYVDLLRPTYKAVKSVDPDATVVGVGGEHSGRHYDNIKTMFEDGGLDYMDAVSVHSYRYPRSPEESDLRGELQAVGDLIRDYGGDQKIWVTEIGWPTHQGPRGVSEFRQARYLVRSHVLMLASGDVTRISWYDFYNDGTNPGYNEHNFGIIHNKAYNCAPKPAAVAYRVMVEELAGHDFQELVRPDSGVYLARFSDGEEHVFVAWTTGEERELDLGDGKAQVRDLMGNWSEATGSMKIGASPVYVESQGIDVSLDQ